MQVLQAGQHKLIFLELDPDLVANAAKQAGFETRLKDSERHMTLDLTAEGRQAPLLLFDAAWIRPTWAGSRAASSLR